MKKVLFFFILSLCFYIQAENNNIKEENTEEDDNTGFNFEEINDEKKDFSVSIGGSIYTGVNLFFSDFKNLKNIKPSSLVWGSLYVEALSPLTYALISFKLNDKTLPFNLGNKWENSYNTAIPRWIDEAFLQIFASWFYFSGGIKKLTWGRIDSLSVLDVVNPVDKTETFLPQESLKMSVPMFQSILYMPKDVKLELVFLPIFQPNLFAIEGKWQTKELNIFKSITNINSIETIKDIMQKDTTNLGYAHGGARLTATINNTHDLGFQYFYGYSKAPYLLKNSGTSYNIEYPQFHNIGFDYGLVIKVLNIKVEACTNIIHQKETPIKTNFEINTNFEISLPYSLTISMLLKETIWTSFIQEKDNTYIFVRNKNLTDTVLYFYISQSLLRQALEWRFEFIANIENKEFFVIPSIHALLGTIILDTKIGICINNNVYSQYDKNSFFKLSLGYAF